MLWKGELRGLATGPPCPCVQENRRIVGGKPVGGNGYPFATGIIYKGYSSLPVCGGTLITDRHVLTAAHCLDKVHITKVLVNVGDYDVRDKKDGKLVPIRKFTKYLTYDEEEFHSDIAIIELKEPVSFNSKIKTIPLPKPDFQLKIGTKVTVFGWGKLYADPDNEEQPDKLHAVTVPVVKNDMCQRVFPIEIEDNMICAGGEAGKDSCEGDSGGGLLEQLNNQYVQVGVVSIGMECGRKGYPAIYSRVSSYMEWILKNTQSAKCKPCIYDEKQ